MYKNTRAGTGPTGYKPRYVTIGRNGAKTCMNSDKTGFESGTLVDRDRTAYGSKKWIERKRRSG